MRKWNCSNIQAQDRVQTCGADAEVLPSRTSQKGAGGIDLTSHATLHCRLGEPVKRQHSTCTADDRVGTQRWPLSKIFIIIVI